MVRGAPESCRIFNSFSAPRVNRDSAATDTRKAKPHGLAYSPAPDASARDPTHLITIHMLAARVRHEQPSRKVVTTP